MSDQADVPWPTCWEAACTGIELASGQRCLAHAGERERDTALDQFTRTGIIDARGVQINGQLLDQLLAGAPRGEDGKALFRASRFDRAIFDVDARFRGVMFEDGVSFSGTTFSGDAEFSGAAFFGDAQFGSATFSDLADFGVASFSGRAGFGEARFSGFGGFGGTTFSGDAEFSGAAFSGDAGFGAAAFSGDAQFGRASFSQLADFGDVTFSGAAGFDRASFSGDAGFGLAVFSGDAQFAGATFSGHAEFWCAVFRHIAWFTGAKFERARRFGPVLAYQELDLVDVEFAQRVQIEVSATGLRCRGARFPNGVQFRLRWAEVVLDDADFPAPSLLSGVPGLSAMDAAGLEEQMVSTWRRPPGGEISGQPQLLSLTRANVAGLVLSNVSVADCRFADAHNLDKLRLEANVRFESAPSRLAKGRQVIAEERDWRVSRRQKETWRASRWPDWLGERPGVLDAGQIADRYRALRKGREDAKNEPGAADFYYGEMEMRRHDGSSAPAGRAIIWLYWLISGYGLRALNSLVALVILGAVVTTALVGWGLAAAALVSITPQQLSGTISVAPNWAVRVNVKVQGVTPQLPPASHRLTGERAETALAVTVESLVFRSTDQPLTTVGTWATIAARILGPILLAMTLLAVRNRVKR